jgi:hypothetical protein
VLASFGFFTKLVWEAGGVTADSTVSRLIFLLNDVLAIVRQNRASVTPAPIHWYVPIKRAGELSVKRGVRQISASLFALYP